MPGEVLLDGKYVIESGPSKNGWSRIEPFIRCERMYQLKHKQHDMIVEKGGNPYIARTGPLARGSLGHAGLAAYYRQKLPRANHWDGPTAMKLIAAKYEIDSEALTAAMIGYNAHMRNPQHAEVIAIEHEVNAVFHDGGERFPVSSALDLVVRDTRGHYWIEDHKFVSSSSGIPDRYTLSGQFLIQQILGRSLYKNKFAGVLIGMNECRDQGQTKHIPLDPSPGACQQFKEAYIFVYRRLAEARKKNYFLPAYNEQICRGVYGLCEFFQNCQWGI